MATIPQELSPVLAAFGLGVPREVQPLGGTATRKWDVHTADGRFVVRVRAAEFADLDSTQFHHAVLRRLHDAGFPVPAVMTRDSGSTWFSQSDKVYEVLSWIGGESFVEGDCAAISAMGSLLARFHRLFADDPPRRRTVRLREDHPDLMRTYLAQWRQLGPDHRQEEQFAELGRQLDYVSRELDTGFYSSLPQSVIHGDVHPGNVRFRQSEVTAMYDFDYLAVQARVRDVSDAIIYFASRHGDTFDADEIGSMVQPYVPDLARCRVLLRGYQSVSALTDPELRALPLLIRSRWIQERLRGARKVAPQQRIHFVLHRFFEVIDWLDREAIDFLQRLKQDL